MRHNNIISYYSTSTLLFFASLTLTSIYLKYFLYGRFFNDKIHRWQYWNSSVEGRMPRWNKKETAVSSQIQQRSRRTYRRFEREDTRYYDREIYSTKLEASGGLTEIGKSLCRRENSDLRNGFSALGRKSVLHETSLSLRPRNGQTGNSRKFDTQHGQGIVRPSESDIPNGHARASRLRLVPFHFASRVLAAWRAKAGLETFTRPVEGEERSFDSQFSVALPWTYWRHCERWGVGRASKTPVDSGGERVSRVPIRWKFLSPLSPTIRALALHSPAAKLYKLPLQYFYRHSRVENSSFERPWADRRRKKSKVPLLNHRFRSWQ